jgi:hypothetical protein
MAIMSGAKNVVQVRNKFGTVYFTQIILRCSEGRAPMQTAVLIIS